MNLDLHKKYSRGFSLVELMVALAAGLVVVGAVLAFTLSSLRSNTDYVKATRLTQELRRSIDFIGRELRRAGYDESAAKYYSQALTVTTPLTSPFAQMFISDTCIIYAYDRGAPAAAGQIVLADGEVRGIRLGRTPSGVGALEIADSSLATGQISCTGASPNYATYPAACSAGGWCPLTDPRTVDITTFSVGSAGSWGQDTPVGGVGTPIQIRDLVITLQGKLVGQDDVARGVTTRVKVRADCLRTATECNATAPVGT